MKHVNERRPCLQLLLSACMLAALMSMGTMAGATTIDFETPSLNGEDSANISPLEIQGVQFIGLEYGYLVRESALFPCSGLSPTNQAYEGWTLEWGCIEGCCPSQLIVIVFPAQPAEPVTHLSLEVRSAYGPLYLRTYDADGVYLGEVWINPAPVACHMSTRGTLEISTARPIATAEIWSGNRPFPGCYDGCCTFGSTIVIDNVTFDGGQLPTAHTSWGSIKALYR